MKQFNSGFIKLLLIALLILPWSTSEALENFEKVGFIDTIDSGHLVIAGQEYRIGPSTRFDSTDKRRNKIAALRPGDLIFVSGKISSGVRYLDIIIFQRKVPS